jgi:DNA-3-methyladenine glycosylase II
MQTFEIAPRGPFTLSSAARFIAGWAPAPREREPQADAVRLGFLVDDWSGHAGVVMRQRKDGVVAVTLTECTAGDPRRACEQACRVVSLDHDGTGYPAVGERDPVVDELQRASGYLRPVLFHSPYEAACWGVISARLRQPIAARIRDRLASQHGHRIDVDGEELLGFPAPERLLEVRQLESLPEVKLRRLHGIAEAALEGRLDRERLLRLDQDAAVKQLQELPGIGQFWSQGIFLRAVGPTDGVTLAEPRVRAKAAERYGRPELVDDDTAFLALVERWRPFRTWVTVLLRAAG